MRRIRAVTREHPFVLDATGAAGYFAVIVANGPDTALDVWSPPVVGLLAVVSASLAVRRAWPLWALAVTAVGTAPATASGADLEPFLVPLAVAIYTVAAHTERWTSRRAVVTGVLCAVPAVALLIGSSGLTGENLGRFTLIGMAAAVGEATRSRRAFIAAIEERAARLELSREEEARRRVVEERLHIARELHDVVAHHISVINVQAGVAGHLLTTRPEAAAEALRHVRLSSRAVLEELHGLLGVLRGSGETGEPTEPAPGMARLGPLVESFRTADLDLRWTSSGEERPLSATVDLVAYRVVQEALTNAHRHGTGVTDLSVTYTETELVIEVANSPGRGSAGGSGLGLVGMRERANAVGGSVRTGLEADRLFHVHVSLPAGKSS
ncbi:histidine kinase [Lentzea sp. NPDC092896]|uniref:sensor histidine kinase n=1 Tax=Lentzea sp. NPDC092896 TaxID=3364127 RepID=UPI0037F484F0